MGKESTRPFFRKLLRRCRTAAFVEDDDDYESEISESDAMARRVWWIGDYRSDDPNLIYTLPGANNDD